MNTKIKYFIVPMGYKLGDFLTHCGQVTQICVFTLQLCRTGDEDLRFYVTNLQDG